MHYPVDKRFRKGTVVLISALLAAWGFHLPSLVFFLSLLLVFHLSFFRDPRPRSVQPHEVLCPAEGTIVDITPVQENRYLRDEAVRIGIFLSIFDAHVNRAPISGKIEYMKYEPGKFFNALKPEASRENESLWLGIENPDSKILIRMISGAIARRICRDVEEKEPVTQGQKLGIICYGSRVEIFVSKTACELNVHLGQKVKVGQTILGEWIG